MVVFKSAYCNWAKSMMLDLSFLLSLSLLKITMLSFDIFYSLLVTLSSMAINDFMTSDSWNSILSRTVSTYWGKLYSYGLVEIKSTFYLFCSDDFICSGNGKGLFAVVFSCWGLLTLDLALVSVGLRASKNRMDYVWTG